MGIGLGLLSCVRNKNCVPFVEGLLKGSMKS